MTALPWLIVPVAYAIGGFSAGYWLVRFRTGTDVRTLGSGATGATNAARVLGRGGFVAVMLLDAAKGALAAVLARAAGLDGGWEFAAAAAVVAGHVWPLQLGFRGGRGLAPLLGAWLVLAPLAIALSLLVAAAAWALSKRRVLSGLLGALLLPATTWWETRSAVAAALAALVFAIVAFAHRSHLPSRASPAAPPGAV
jgi:acyl phosphate:glycerol-3-phosphate acyltransferase